MACYLWKAPVTPNPKLTALGDGFSALLADVVSKTGIQNLFLDVLMFDMDAV